jgi:hypothetical protein
VRWHKISGLKNLFIYLKGKGEAEVKEGVLGFRF